MKSHLRIKNLFVPYLLTWRKLLILSITTFWNLTTFSYGIRDTPNNWFSSYLTNRNQFVTINSFYFDLQYARPRVPQGSVLGSLIFFLYTNDLHNAIKFSTPLHFADETFSTPLHFADETSILNKQNSPDKINKTLNKGALKELSFWLNAIKIALNATKTEAILLKNNRQTSISKLNLKLCRTKLHPVNLQDILELLLIQTQTNTR